MNANTTFKVICILVLVVVAGSLYFAYIKKSNDSAKKEQVVDTESKDKKNNEAFFLSVKSTGIKLTKDLVKLFCNTKEVLKASGVSEEHSDLLMVVPPVIVGFGITNLSRIWVIPFSFLVYAGAFSDMEKEDAQKSSEDRQRIGLGYGLGQFMSLLKKLFQKKAFFK